MPPHECPVCGEDVPPNAAACPECGACDKSGWNEDTDADGLGLPDEGFDYDQFVASEFGKKPPPSGLQLVWISVAILVLLALLMVGL